MGIDGGREGGHLRIFLRSRKFLLKTCCAETSYQCMLFSHMFIYSLLLFSIAAVIYRHFCRHSRGAADSGLTYI